MHKNNQLQQYYSINIIYISVSRSILWFFHLNVHRKQEIFSCYHRVSKNTHDNNCVVRYYIHRNNHIISIADVVFNVPCISVYTNIKMMLDLNPILLLPMANYLSFVVATGIHLRCGRYFHTLFNNIIISNCIYNLYYFNIMIFVVCPNSDGLSKFAWSHNGFWKPGGSLMGHKNTALKCAEPCLEDPKCVAINYHHSGDSPQACYHYHDRTTLKYPNQMETKFTKSHMKAYIKCRGSYRWCTLYTYFMFNVKVAQFLNICNDL